MTTVLGELLEKESLVSHYQPILSVKKKRCVGVEALARGSNASTGRPLSPLQLFEWAADEGQLLDLDRLCRRKALENFVGLHANDPELLLFLNFEVSVLDEGVLGSGALLNAVRGLDLKPESVVIEINESKVQDIESLRAFVDRYKSYGFLIALDDLGTGHSNLQRLAVLKPDILKLDRSLIQGLGSDFFKQEIFKSLVSLARNIGALVLAEGVETESEVTTSLGLGADLFQGYYFSRPVEAGAWDLKSVHSSIDHSANRYKDNIVKEMLRRRSEAEKHRGLLAEIGNKLGGGSPEGFDHSLSGTVMQAREVECLYVLDRYGFQVSRTITMQFMRGRARGVFPARPQGGRHIAMKDYYYGLVDAAWRASWPEPYISLASGNLCRTLSCIFEGASKKDYVLCMDVKCE